MAVSQVGSLLCEGKPATTIISLGDDEDDIFQCGKCGNQFSSLASFVSHKQECLITRKNVEISQNVQSIIQTSSNASVGNSNLNILQLPIITSQENKKNALSVSPVQQALILGNNMMSFSICKGSIGLPVKGQEEASSSSESKSDKSNHINLKCPGAAANGNGNSMVSITQPIILTSSNMGQNILQGRSVLTTLSPLKVSGCVTNFKPILPAQSQKVNSKSSDGIKKKANVCHVLAPPNPNGDLSKVVKDKSNFDKKAGHLKCQFCGKQFFKNFDLLQHVRSHTGEKPFQCVVCGRGFSQRSNVKKHMNTHKVWPQGLSETLPKQPIKKEQSKSEGEVEEIVVDKSYICPFCSSKLPSYLEFKSHLAQHKDKKVFKCVMAKCQQVCDNLDDFLIHVRSHQTELQYRCHVCDKMFDSLYKLGIHQYSHVLNSSPPHKSVTNLYHCNKCSNKYSSPETLQHHLTTNPHHYKCVVCNKVFQSERNLRKHLPYHGTGYRCDVCNKVFKSEHYLKHHKLIHSGEKPFECSLCKSAFNRKDKLKRHMLTHDPHKKFKCPFQGLKSCAKEFNRADKLKAHLLTHTKDRGRRGSLGCGRPTIIKQAGISSNCQGDKGMSLHIDSLTCGGEEGVDTSTSHGSLDSLVDNADLYDSSISVAKQLDELTSLEQSSSSLDADKFITEVTISDSYASPIGTNNLIQSITITSDHQSISNHHEITDANQLFHSFIDNEVPGARFEIEVDVKPTTHIPMT